LLCPERPLDLVEMLAPVLRAENVAARPASVNADLAMIERATVLRNGYTREP